MASDEQQIRRLLQEWLRCTAAGDLDESSGHVLTVFRKSADGTWQLARDANLVAGAGNPDRV